MVYGLFNHAIFIYRVILQPMEDVSFYAKLAWIISEAFLGASEESQRSHGCKDWDHVYNINMLYTIY